MTDSPSPSDTPALPEKPAVVHVWDGSELGTRTGKRASTPPAPPVSINQAVNAGRDGHGSGNFGSGSGRNKPR